MGSIRATIIGFNIVASKIRIGFWEFLIIKISIMYPKTTGSRTFLSSSASKMGDPWL